MYMEPDCKIGFYGNDKEFRNFIGEDNLPTCSTCGGYGEYETGYGPQGCMLCSSRLVQFIDYCGKKVLADWGDEVIKNPMGLMLIKNYKYD